MPKEKKERLTLAMRLAMVKTKADEGATPSDLLQLNRQYKLPHAALYKALYKSPLRPYYLILTAGMMKAMAMEIEQLLGVDTVSVTWRKWSGCPGFEFTPKTSSPIVHCVKVIPVAHPPSLNDGGFLIGGFHWGGLNSSKYGSEVWVHIVDFDEKKLPDDTPIYKMRENYVGMWSAWIRPCNQPSGSVPDVYSDAVRTVVRKHGLPAYCKTTTDGDLFYPLGICESPYAFSVLAKFAKSGRTKLDVNVKGYVPARMRIYDMDISYLSWPKFTEYYAKPIADGNITYAEIATMYQAPLGDVMAVFCKT
jgi:hypothetical protein